MKMRIVSFNSLLVMTSVSAVLLAGVVACDFPFTVTVPGIGDIGVSGDDSNSNTNDNSAEDVANTNDNSAEDVANTNESDEDVANDNSGDEGTNDGIDDNDNDNGQDDDDALDDDSASDDGRDDGDGDDDGNGAGSLVGNADDGSARFATTCAVCHGDDATGVIGPNIQAEEFDDIFDHAVDGHEGHTMFDLVDQDVADIEAFLATLGQ